MYWVSDLVQVSEMWYIFTHIEHIPCAQVMDMADSDSVYRGHLTYSNADVLGKMSEK